MSSTTLAPIQNGAPAAAPMSWRRPLPPELVRQLAVWARRAPRQFEGSWEIPGTDFSSATQGLPTPWRTWLEGDIRELLSRCAQLTGVSSLRVFFGAVRTDRCRKFHVDYVQHRLVTTYVGPGTEWVPDASVNRLAMEHPHACPMVANRAIVPDLSVVRRAGAGEVLLLPGKFGPNSPGVVHRSPPIEGTGVVRVVLIASTVHNH